MPSAPSRFIHATRVRLDCPLRDTGPLPEESRPIIERATITSFERIVAECIECKVDGLLLVGDTFCEADQSLPARVALLNGLDDLHESDVSVYVMPGELDRLSAWQNMQPLPDHVALCPTVNDLPVELPVDLPPIASQGLSPAETGPHGCHLLELQPSGSAKWTLIPTAPVRWEQLSLQIDEHASRDDLIEQMLGQLEQHRPLPNEQVWLVEWRVSGLGELTLRLADPEEQQTLLSLLGQLAPHDHVQYHHTLRVRAAWSHDAFHVPQSLAAECLDRLAARRPLQRVDLERMLESVPDLHPHLRQRLHDSIETVDTDEIAETAGRLAAAWLNTDDEGRID